jgi:hypothetical protein
VRRNRGVDKLWRPNAVTHPQGGLAKKNAGQGLSGMSLREGSIPAKKRLII